MKYTSGHSPYLVTVIDNATGEISTIDDLGPTQIIYDVSRGVSYRVPLKGSPTKAPANGKVDCTDVTPVKKGILKRLYKALINNF